MGNTCCLPYFDEDVVGAYEYQCAGQCPPWMFLLFPFLFICGRPGLHWRAGGCDGMKFVDPRWAKSTPLRKRFEKELFNNKMAECLDEAPKACTCLCGGCKTVTRMEPHLNENWCRDINDRFLCKEGYKCRAHHWITYGSKGERQEHMALVIKKISTEERNLFASNSRS